MHHDYLDQLPTRPTRWIMTGVLLPFCVLIVGGAAAKMIPQDIAWPIVIWIISVCVALHFLQSPAKKAEGRAQADAEIQAMRHYVEARWTRWRVRSRDSFRRLGATISNNIIRQQTGRITGSGRQRGGAAGRRAQAKAGNDDSDGGGDGEPPRLPFSRTALAKPLGISSKTPQNSFSIASETFPRAIHAPRVSRLRRTAQTTINRGDLLLDDDKVSHAFAHEMFGCALRKTGGAQ